MLLVDIGNTRVKWALFENGALLPQHVLPLSELSTERLHGEFVRVIGDNPHRVVVANVASAEVAATVAMVVRKEWGITAEFIASTTELAGVRNGYSNPAQLGVDRWLATVAGYDLTRDSVCVVCVGTALTIDAVGQNGSHLGGLIIPGPDLMVESLLRNTAGIAKRMEDFEPGMALLATDTKAAVQQGSQHACAALIERFLGQIGMHIASAPTLLITGGASGRILPGLGVPFRVVPNLVMRGLCLAAGERLSA